MRVIIAGGRDIPLTYDSVMRYLDIIEKLDRMYFITGILSGKCKTGGDWIGEHYARIERIKVQPYQADWDKYGLAAGPIRNEEMAKDAHGIILFRGNKGTNSMRKLACKYRLQFLYDEDQPHMCMP